MASSVAEFAEKADSAVHLERRHEAVEPLRRHWILVFELARHIVSQASRIAEGADARNALTDSESFGSGDRRKNGPMTAWHRPKNPSGERRSRGEEGAVTLISERGRGPAGSISHELERCNDGWMEGRSNHRSATTYNIVPLLLGCFVVLVDFASSLRISRERQKSRPYRDPCSRSSRREVQHGQSTNPLGSAVIEEPANWFPQHKCNCYQIRRPITNQGMGIPNQYSIIADGCRMG